MEQIVSCLAINADARNLNGIVQEISTESITSTISRYILPRKICAVFSDDREQSNIFSRQIIDICGLKDFGVITESSESSEQDQRLLSEAMEVASFKVQRGIESRSDHFLDDFRGIRNNAWRLKNELQAKAYILGRKNLEETVFCYVSQSPLIEGLETNEDNLLLECGIREFWFNVSHEHTLFADSETVYPGHALPVN